MMVRAALCLALLLPSSAFAQTEIRLHPGDALRVEVKNEPPLSGQFTVTADGSVMLPLLGLIRVADRPLPDVLAELRAAYGAELTEPEVLLTPLVRVAVVGEVRAPGLFLADPTHTLADVLTMAGGPLPTAHRKKLTLMRDGQEHEIEPGAASADLARAARSGDRLYVPRRSWLSDNLGILVGAAASVAAAAVTSWIVR
jgi:polysaccharide export outer membrane protein